LHQSLEGKCGLGKGYRKSAEDAPRQLPTLPFNVSALAMREGSMPEQARGRRVHERWSHFRFSVIGQLLAAPPPRGELAGAITALAEHTWRHPITDKPTRFGFSTIERWYYLARLGPSGNDP
jgi:hypothetical protein